MIEQPDDEKPEANTSACHRCECVRCRTNRLKRTEFDGAGRAIPVIPPLPPDRQTYDPNPIVARCGECGLDLRRVMNYVCGNSRCPVQPRTVCWTSSGAPNEEPRTVYVSPDTNGSGCPT